MKNKTKLRQADTRRAMIALRKSHKVSQAYVANESGYSVGYLSMLEKGYRKWNADLVNIFTEAIRRAVITKKQKQIEMMERIAMFR